MLLKISKLSKFDKYHWESKPLKNSILSKFSKKADFIYKNEDFDEVLSLILTKLEYDYIELSIWSFQLDLFSNIEYNHINNRDRFSIITLDKSNSIKILNPRIYEEIRLFEINVFNGNEKLLNIKSDNYGEHTSITVDKSISKERLLLLLNNVFTSNEII